MKSVGLREAKAKLSELVDSVQEGELVTITRHGEPEAVLVSFQDAQKLGLMPRSSFADLLLSFPGGIEFERDRSPIRDIEF